MPNMTRIGFGQVEPNHLSAKRTSQIYAQLPAAADIKILENGQYVKYDYANGEVNFTGAGEWMLVYNEVKLYDDRWRESYKDFALKAENFTEGSDTIAHEGYGPFKGQMYPRVFKTNIGDIYTTNCLAKANTDGKAVVEMEEYALMDELTINAEGFLTKAAAADDYEGPVFQVVKVYTMPDGQAAVKVMRIK